MFHGSPSSYLWKGDSRVRTIEQGEGGEQGDAVMPLLFSLGQHAALHAVQGRLEAGERLFAFLGDIWVVTALDRVGPACTAIREALWQHSRIRVHEGITKVWSSGGIRPVACDMLERIARENNPNIREVRVWRGGGPNRERGISVLGTPLGHPDFVAAHLQKILAEH